MSAIDKSDLRGVILTEHGQFTEGRAAAEHVQINGSFQNIVISGMGGSALHANVLRMYINDRLAQSPHYTRFNIFQNRYYELPGEAYDNALNIFCSHSGNTEETIASFQEALENKLLCIGISAGGKIEEICKENNIPHVKLPIPFDNFQPRMATGHFVSAIITVLTNAGVLPVDTAAIDAVATKLENDVPTLEERAQEIAGRLVGKTPVVYASTKFKAAALIWKIKLNENAKVPAFWNFFPELNHNEFVGFTNPQANFYVLMLRNADDHERNKKRFDVSSEFLNEKGVETEIIEIPDGDMLYRIFWILALGDWMSYHLALNYGIDPTPVDMVEDFKVALG